MTYQKDQHRNQVKISLNLFISQQIDKSFHVPVSLSCSVVPSPSLSLSLFLSLSLSLTLSFQLLLSSLHPLLFTTLSQKAMTAKHTAEIMWPITTSFFYFFNAGLLLRLHRRNNILQPGQKLFSLIQCAHFSVIELSIAKQDYSQ